MHVYTEAAPESWPTEETPLECRRPDEGVDSREETEEDDGFLSLYLNEAAHYPLLNRTEEQQVARAMWAAERKLRRRASRLETAAARRQFKRARDRLIQCNLRLVVSIAKRYQKPGVDLLDLVQEGNIGLMQAVERFDPRRGLKFSTYATWWIRQAVARYLSKKSRTIRVPIHKLMLQRMALRERLILEQRLGRKPTWHEVSAEVGASVSKVQEAIGSVPKVQSLDAGGGEDGRSRCVHRSDARCRSPWKAAVDRELHEKLCAAIELLPERQQWIVRMRFGIEVPAEFWLEDIGRALHLSRERVRQLEVEALDNLRAIAGTRHLREFLTD